MTKLFLKLAYLASVPIMVLVAYFACQQPLSGTPPDIQMLALILPIVYVVEVVLVLPILMAVMRRGNDSPQAQLSRMTIRMAFFESGAIYGLILALQSHHFAYAWHFGLPAFFLMLIFG